MKIKKTFFFFITFLYMHAACVKSFVPEIEKYDRLLVIDGWLTDAPGPYTVKLSHSSQLLQLVKYIPYGGCKVSVSDNLGNTYPLNEITTGTYQTDSTTCRGIVGRRYKLTVVTTDGNKIESTEEELIKPIEIAQVYAELEHREDPNKFFGRDGFQFYIDLKPQPTNKNFLFWDLDCTYKFRTDFPIFAYYANGTRHKVRDTDTLRMCYRNVDILELFTHGTKELNQTEIKRFPLNFEDNYTKALSIRYSLRVKQFTINEGCYNYWNTIKKLKDSQADLFTKQPFQLKNNLTNLTNTGDPVLGYFTVAGYSEERIFVNRPAIEDRYDVCAINGVPVKYLDEFLATSPELWPYFLPDSSYGDHFIDQECLDCTKRGVLTKPAFWKD